MHAIICDSRKGVDLGIFVLALVDRRKTTERWWTSDTPDHIMCFDTEKKAQEACRKLKHNNPKVIPYAAAVDYITEQREVIRLAGSLEEAAGWDAHKLATKAQ